MLILWQLPCKRFWREMFLLFFMYTLKCQYLFLVICLFYGNTIMERLLKSYNYHSFCFCYYYYNNHAIWLRVLSKLHEHVVIFPGFEWLVKFMLHKSSNIQCISTIPLHRDISLFLYTLIKFKNQDCPKKSSPQEINIPYKLHQKKRSKLS